MTDDNSQDAKKSQRQKITIGVMVVVVVIILWQVKGLFSGGSAPVEEIPAASATAAKQSAAQPPAPMPTPQAAQVPKGPAVAPAAATEQMSPQVAQLMQQQQETQQRYIAAINTLQMLKISKEIAETTQAIMSAKLATVVAQKNILDMLTPAAPPKVSQADYAQGLVNPSGGSTGQVSSPTASTFNQQQDKEMYTVVSVSQLQGQWSAVLGYQTELYSVVPGDVLAPDGSKVVSIGKSGVTLKSKDGTTRRVSLVPII